MNQVFQYTQTIHNILVASKCTMRINGNTMTASDVGQWFNGSVHLIIDKNDQSYEWIPGVPPAVLYDKFNHTAHNFTVDMVNYPSQADLTISSSEITALTGNLVVNTQKYVRPGFTVTSAVVTNLNNQHCTLRVNNAVVAAGVIIYSADTVALYANTGYRFKTDASGNASVYFAHGNEHLYATLNSDKTIATITMRMPNNETRNFWETLAVVSEVKPADDVTSYVVREVDLNNDPNVGSITRNGVQLTVGTVIHAGDVLVFTTKPGYRWVDNNVNNPWPTLTYEDVDKNIYRVPRTLNSDATVGTVHVPVLTGGNKWRDQGYTIGLYTEQIPNYNNLVKTYTLTAKDIATLTGDGIESAKINNVQVTAGTVINAGVDHLVVTAKKPSYKFLNRPNMMSGSNTSGWHGNYIGDLSTDGYNATIILPTLAVGESWYTGGISLSTTKLPDVTRYTLTKADYDLLALHSVALIRNNIRLIAGDIIHAGDVISAKITTRYWEFYNPSNNVGLTFQHNDRTPNLNWHINQSDSTITESLTFPTLSGGTAWYAISVGNIHTREMPFEKRTWLNIYAVEESDLPTLKRDLAIASTVNSQPTPIKYSDYVVGVVELPYAIPDYERLRDTYVSVWDISTSCPGRMFQDGVLRYDLGTISVPKPDIPTLAYHSTAKLFLPRFSEIELDINLVFGYNIRVEYLVNLETGIVTVNVYSDNPNTRNGAVLSQTANWNISVPWNATTWGSITNTEIPLNEENNIVTPYIEIETQETIQSNIFTVPILTNEKFNIANKGYYEVEQVKFLAQNYNMSAADREDFIAALKDGFILE